MLVCRLHRALAPEPSPCRATTAPVTGSPLLAVGPGAGPRGALEVDQQLVLPPCGADAAQRALDLHAVAAVDEHPLAGAGVEHVGDEVPVGVVVLLGAVELRQRVVLVRLLGSGPVAGGPVGDLLRGHVAQVVATAHGISLTTSCRTPSGPIVLLSTSNSVPPLNRISASDLAAENGPTLLPE